jgi:hypothetical protein
MNYAQQIRPHLEKLIAQNQIDIYNPRTLCEKSRESLMAQFLPIARECFSTHMTYEDIYEHSFTVDRLTILYDTKRHIIGFSTVNYFDFAQLRLLYINGSFIAPQHQGQHHYAALKLLDFEIDPNVTLFAARTQNPIVYATLAKFGKLVPSQTREPTESEISEYNAVAKLLNQGDIRPGDILKNCYGSCLYDHPPTHPKVTPFFFPNWDSSNTEAMLFLLLVSINR